MALTPRSTQGHCTLCCPLPANRRPTPRSSSARPAELEGAIFFPPGSHSSPHLLERFKESDARCPFLPQCDTADFSLLSAPGNLGLTLSSLGLGLCALNSSLHSLRNTGGKIHSKRSGVHPDALVSNRAVVLNLNKTGNTA